jgi:hypothetical protein
MKAGNFNFNDYMTKLQEAEESNTEKGYADQDLKQGIILPEDTKKNFDWLNKEFQKGKVEVKIEVKGEGSSFKPGYDLQTDLDSVKDFKPGMYGDVKTGDTNKKDDGPLPRGQEPSSPNKKTEEPAKEAGAEDKDPKGGKEAADKQEEKSDKSPKKQSMNLNATKKDEDDK